MMNVYDFDNTLYDGESCLDMFFYFLKKDPSLLKSAPKIVYAFAQYKKGKVTVEQALEKYAPEVEAYFRKNPGILSDTSDFWDKHMKNIKPFYKELQKPDDIIITASPEDSMKEICRRLGIDRYVGSVIDSETGKITRLCLRENKVKAFLDICPEGRMDAFYTDSPENDAPLIALADRAYRVTGNRIIRIK